MSSPASAPLVSFSAAMEDPQLFGRWFDGPSWATWKAIVKAEDGEPLTPDEADIFARIARGRTPPTAPVQERWTFGGRRGGKSLVVAAQAVHAATCVDYSPFLKPGERAVVMILAADRAQSAVTFRYAEAFFDHVPLFGALVASRTKDSIDLVNGVTIQVGTSNFRLIRGRTVCFAVLEEVCFWYDDQESRNPASEVIAALRPAMATIPTARLVVVTSTYRRDGIAWETYRRYFGIDDPDVLVLQAPTTVLNPIIDQKFLAAEFEKDPAAAAAEYNSEWRRDIEAFVPREVVEALVVQGRASLPPVQGFRYVAFVDPSGGSQDSMTLAIAHSVQGGKTVLDLVVEHRAPFGPDDVVQEFVWHLAPYGVSRVTGDRYAGEWPREGFRKYGIAYEVSEHTKSDLYQATLPLLMSHQVALLDHPRLVGQLSNLERVTSRAGRDTIGPPPRGHDDVANAAAGALVLAARRRVRMLEGYPTPAASKEPPPGRRCHHGYAERRCPACSPGWTFRDLVRGGSAV